MRPIDLARFKRFPYGNAYAGMDADPECRGFVYVIGPEVDRRPVKIGVTENLWMRIDQIQCGCWRPLRVLGAVAMYGDLYPVETLAHKMALVYGERLQGEWFDISVDEALRSILKAAESTGTRHGAHLDAWEIYESDHKLRIIAQEGRRRMELAQRLNVEC